MRFVKRRTQEQATLAVDPADHSDGVLSELIIKEGVQEALARLSERHRTILQMKYVAGMTTAEIADACELKESLVERELTAARRLLKPLLANHLKGRHS
jgi:RNA polymerase sigma factor (sigma-70 family)